MTTTFVPVSLTLSTVRVMVCSCLFEINSNLWARQGGRICAKNTRGLSIVRQWHSCVCINPDRNGFANRYATSERRISNNSGVTATLARLANLRFWGLRLRRSSVIRSWASRKYNITPGNKRDDRRWVWVSEKFGNNDKYDTPVWKSEVNWHFLNCQCFFYTGHFSYVYISSFYLFIFADTLYRYETALDFFWYFQTHIFYLNIDSWRYLDWRVEENINEENWVRIKNIAHLNIFSSTDP